MCLFEKYKSEELNDMIHNQKLSYKEIGRYYGVSDSYIKKIAKKLGIVLVTRSKFPENWVPHNKGKKEKTMCKNCGLEYLSMHKGSKYCSINCQSEYKKNKNYEYYLNNQQEYYGMIKTISSLKPHILKEQNYCCHICNIKNEWNNKPLVFVLDHINGDASDNRRENLRLICSNCDSQLDTYKSKNKNSARKKRYEQKNYDSKTKTFEFKTDEIGTKEYWDSLVRENKITTNFNLRDITNPKFRAKK